MIALPRRGLARSVRKHNCSLNTVADWVEASAINEGEPVSQSDVIDCLIEHQIYREQDFCSEFVDDVWQVLKARSKRMGDCTPMTLTKSSADFPDARDGWSALSAYALCVLLSLLPQYREKNEEADPRPDYNIQGWLFEEITASSLQAQGWSVHTTGWQTKDSEGNPPFDELVLEIQLFLDEFDGNDHVIEVLGQRKDAGVDLVCANKYPDLRGAYPSLFVQCASGANWRGHKLLTPSLDVWRRIIQFKSVPLRAFSIPFSLSNTEYEVQVSNSVLVLLDRSRLFAVPGVLEGLKAESKAAVEQWVAEAFDELAEAAI